VRGIFAVGAGVTDQHVLLIDDVGTTGTTINRAATALLDAGACPRLCWHVSFKGRGIWRYAHTIALSRISSSLGPL